MILKIMHGRMDEITNITNLLNHEELTIEDEPYVSMIMDMIHSDLALLGMVINLSFHKLTCYLLLKIYFQDIKNFNLE